MSLSCFNPTLVRLRQGGVDRPLRGRGICFNPTLVRLRRHRRLQRLLARRWSFNPTLVRLRPCDFRG